MTSWFTLASPFRKTPLGFRWYFSKDTDWTSQTTTLGKNIFLCSPNFFFSIWRVLCANDDDAKLPVSCEILLVVVGNSKGIKSFHFLIAASSGHNDATRSGHKNATSSR